MITPEAIEHAMLHNNSAARPYAFLDLQLEGEQFWSAVIEWWSGFDLIPHDYYELEFQYQQSKHPGHPCKAGSECVAWFDALPDVITIYRGQSSASAPGLSWTTSREAAQQFSRGHRGYKISSPIIYEETVSKSEVAIATNDRSEFEIVLFEIPEI